MEKRERFSENGDSESDAPFMLCIPVIAKRLTLRRNAWRGAKARRDSQARGNLLIVLG